MKRPLNKYLDTRAYPHEVLGVFNTSKGRVELTPNKLDNLDQYTGLRSFAEALSEMNELEDLAKPRREWTAGRRKTFEETGR